MADPTPKTAPSAPRPPLSALQMELLKLYSTEMTAEEVRELKHLLAQYFAARATAAADRIWDERGLSDADMDAWLDA